MFRFLIGYLSGTVMGILLIVSLITRDQSASALIIFALWIIILVLGLVWSHKHHIKKRDEYYKKIRGPSKWLL